MDYLPNNYIYKRQRITQSVLRRTYRNIPFLVILDLQYVVTPHLIIMQLSPCDFRKARMVLVIPKSQKSVALNVLFFYTVSWQFPFKCYISRATGPCLTIDLWTSSIRPLKSKLCSLPRGLRMIQPTPSSSSTSAFWASVQYFPNTRHNITNRHE